MKLDLILKKNEDYNLEAIRLGKQIIELNNQILIKDFETMDYDSAKIAFELIKNNLSSYDKKKEFEKMLEVLKAEKYPILNMAHYYPIINEIDFLTNEQKNSVDKFLKKYQSCKFSMESSFLWEIGINDFGLVSQVFKFLINKNIIKKQYAINCEECEQVLKFFSEEEYQNSLKFHRTTENDILKMTDAEKEEHYKWDTQEFCCTNCEEMVSVDLNILEIAEMYYKNVAEAEKDNYK